MMKPRWMRAAARVALVAFACASSTSWAGDLSVVLPQDGGLVGGANIACVAEFKNADQRITRIDFLVDGYRLTGQAVTPGEEHAQATFVWDATGVEPGEHKLTLRAYAGNQLVATDSIRVMVAEDTGPDLLAPQVHITFPRPNSQVVGPAQIQLQAYDNAGISMVSLFIDKQLKLLQNVPPFTYLWDTTRYANGAHVIEAWAFDRNQNRGEARPIRVMVNNPGGFTQLEEPAAATQSAKPEAVRAIGKQPTVEAAEAPKPPTVGAARPKGAPEIEAPAPEATEPTPAAPAKPRPLFLNLKAVPRTATPRVAAPKPVAPRPAAVKAANPKVTVPAPAAPKPVVPRAAVQTRTAPKAAVQTPRALVAQAPRAPKAEPSVASAPTPPARVMLAQALPVRSVVDQVEAFSPVITPPAVPKPVPAAKIVAPKVSAPAKAAVAKAAPAPRPERPGSVSPEPAAPKTSDRVAARPAPAAKSAVAAAAKPVSEKAAVVRRVAAPSVAALKPVPAQPVRVALKPVPRGSEALLAATEPVFTAPRSVKPAAAPAAKPAVAPKPRPAMAQPTAAARPAVVRTVASAKPAAAPLVKPVPAPAATPTRVARAAATSAPKPAPARPAPLRVAALPKSEASHRGSARPAELLQDQPFSFQHRLRDLKVALEGQPVDFDVAPMSVNGVAFAPLRQIVEHSGGVVLWLPATRTVRAITASHRVQLTIGSRRSFVDGRLVLMDRPVFLERGRTMVPLRYLEAALDLRAVYDPERGLVSLSRQ